MLSIDGLLFSVHAADCGICFAGRQTQLSENRGLHPFASASGFIVPPYFTVPGTQ